jgi:hypothetical protein
MRFIRNRRMNKNPVFESKRRMRKIRSIKIAFWVVILPVSTGWAFDAGTSSANFLKIGIGPRAIAMGEAQVALADDVYATYWNPAGLARLATAEAGFAHAQYLQSINEEYAAYAMPTGAFGTFAGSISYFNVGKFQGFDASGQPTTDVGANDMAVGFSYAHALYHDRRYGADLSAGVTGRWVRERLDTESASAYGGDLGMIFTPGIRWGEFLSGWKAGAVLRNVGTSMKYDQDSFPLPRSLSAGLSYTGAWLGEDITVAVDGTQPNDGRRYIGAGLEVWTFRTLVLRGGYTSQGDLGTGLRMGAGIKFKTLQVDYAFAGQGDMGNTQYVGLTFHFKESQPDPKYLAQVSYENGMKDYKKKRYTEALVKFNKALELDPSHPEALKMMKQTYEQIKLIVPE